MTIKLNHKRDIRDRKRNQAHRQEKCWCGQAGKPCPGCGEILCSKHMLDYSHNCSYAGLA